MVFIKRLLFGFVAFSMLHVSYANAYVDDVDGSDSSVYLQLGYQPSYVGSQDIDGAVSVNRDGSSSAKAYNPSYAFNLFGFNVAAGKSFGSSARVDFEVAFNHDFVVAASDAKFDIDHDSSTSSIVRNGGFNAGVAAVNVYYDLDVGTSYIVPYLGVGGGLGRVSATISDVNYVTYPIALQFKAGLKMPNDILPFYVGYKLVYLFKQTIGDVFRITGTKSPNSINVSYMLHDIDVGVNIVR